MTLHGSLTIPYRLDNEAALEQLVATWKAAAPGLLPQRAGADEPVRTPFDPNDLAAALPAWRQRSWIARRTRPSMYASFLTGSRLHSVANIHLAGGDDELHALADLVRALWQVFSGDFAMVHRLTAAETAEARSTRRPDLMFVGTRSDTALLSTGFTKRLQDGLPTLYWMTLFGPAYLDLFGRRTLLAAPAFKVQEAQGGVVLQLTEFAPTEESWSTFRAARDRVMEHLGHDVFAPSASRVADALTRVDAKPWPGGEGASE